MSTATATRKKAKASGMTISTDALRAALAAVEKAVVDRSPKPVLRNVLIGNETMTGTDLELRITAPLPGATQEALLPFKRLDAILRSVVGVQDVTVQVDGQRCRIAAGQGEWVIPTEDPAEFPAAAEAKQGPIARMPGDQFHALMKTVSFATDNQSSRYSLGGVLIEFSSGTLYFVASDGRRLAVAQADIDQATDDATALVPLRAIEALSKWAKTAEVVQLDKTESELVATVDEVVMRARLVDGRFPRWRDVEPEYTTTPSMVVAGSLLHACEMAAVCTSEASKGVVWTIAHDGLRMRGQSSEYGQSEATCELVQCGAECTVKIDPLFAEQWLRSVDPAETISVEAKDSDSAVVLRAGDCRTVIMPLAKD